MPQFYAISAGGHGGGGGHSSGGHSSSSGAHSSGSTTASHGESISGGSHSTSGESSGEGGHVSGGSAESEYKPATPPATTFLAVPHATPASGVATLQQDRRSDDDGLGMIVPGALSAGIMFTIGLVLLRGHLRREASERGRPW